MNLCRWVVPAVMLNELFENDVPNHNLRWARFVFVPLFKEWLHGSEAVVALAALCWSCAGCYVAI